MYFLTLQFIVVFDSNGFFRRNYIHFPKKRLNVMFMRTIHNTKFTVKVKLKPLFTRKSLMYVDVYSIVRVTPIRMQASV